MNLKIIKTKMVLRDENRKQFLTFFVISQKVFQISKNILYKSFYNKNISVLITLIIFLKNNYFIKFISLQLFI